MTPSWRRYLRFWGPRVDGDVDDELAFHLEMRVRDYVHRGMTQRDAARPPSAASAADRACAIARVASDATGVRSKAISIRDGRPAGGLASPRAYRAHVTFGA